VATLKEKEELIDTIKGPRYYRVSIWGYGGESAYIDISKKAKDFWKPILDEHGDGDLVNYCINAEDERFNFDNIESVPPEANFLSDDEEGIGACSSWYEAPTELEHQWGVDFGSGNITVEEQKNKDYNSPVIRTIVDGEPLNDWTDEVMKQDDYKTEITDMQISEYESWTAPHILQFYSSEKGTFFDGIIETYGNFDPKKLMFHCLEYANGDDTLISVDYDGQEISNDGGDTNGKGYSAHIWDN